MLRVSERELLVSWAASERSSRNPEKNVDVGVGALQRAEGSVLAIPGDFRLRT